MGKEMRELEAQETQETQEQQESQQTGSVMLEQDEQEVKRTQPDAKITELIQEAIDDGERDAEHCLILRRRVKETVGKEILRQIRLDHLKHIGYLRDIHEEMTGEAPMVGDVVLPIAAALDEEWENGVFRALNQVEFLRQIAFSFAGSAAKDIIYEIITDKQAHAIKLEHLYNKYGR